VNGEKKAKREFDLEERLIGFAVQIMTGRRRAPSPARTSSTR
jgi:hypothetical protein